MNYNQKLVKHTIRPLLIFMMFPCLLAGQSQQTFHHFSYYKVLPGKEGEFRSIVKEVDARVQQERVNKGAISAWYFYEVLSPAGSNAEYDFFTVTTGNGFKTIYESPYPFDSALKKILRGKDPKFFATYNSRLAGISTLVKEEIYSSMAVADSNFMDGFQAKYVMIDFMQPKPEKFSQYIKSEIDTFRLIHKERMKLGAISQWSFLQLVLPFDSKTGYSHLALNFYKEFDMMFEAKYEEGLKKVFPDVSLSNLFQSVAAARDNPRAELSRLILCALPGKQ